MPAATACAIFHHLPETSALWRREHPWTLDRHIAVRTLEEVHQLGRIQMAAAGVKKSKLPKPLVVPRPGDKPPDPKPSKSWLAALIDQDEVQVVRVGA